MNEQLRRSAAGTATPAETKKVFSPKLPTLDKEANLWKFKNWMQAWEEQYKIHSGESYTNDQQVAVYLNSLGLDWGEIVRKTLDVDANKATIKEIEVRITKHLRSKRNITAVSYTHLRAHET